MKKLEKFKELGLSDRTIEALIKKGFEEPSPIQALCIPHLLTGDHDVIGQAQTGTGKTAAFSLPIIEQIEPAKNVQAIVLAPTRELCIQVADEIVELKGSKGLRILPIYGGVAIDRQMRKLKEGIDIVVGTPGRVQDLLRRKKLKIDNIKFFILDEADEMLNMGFLEDIEDILDYTNDDKKMLFFSATMPKEILEVAKTYMKNHKVLAVKKTELTTDLVAQIYYEVSNNDKFEALARVIDIEDEFYGIIFCKTKNDVDTVTHKLIDRGYFADCIHGDISQNQREKVLAKFKNKRVNILIATDVAARGIDVNNLTHVINYSLPQDPESYVHRIGRTGRAGNEGTAITFVTPREYNKLSLIQRVTKKKMSKETLPQINEIIEAKKGFIIDQVVENINNKALNRYKDLAKSIMENTDLDNIYDVLASALQIAYPNDLDESNYKTIREPKKGRDRDRDKSRNDRNDRNDRNSRRSNKEELDSHTRLFIARGAKDGMNVGQLIGLISKKGNVARNLIQRAQVFDAFSFVSVPFQEAEKIVQAFKRERVNSGKQALVEKARR